MRSKFKQKQAYTRESLLRPLLTLAIALYSQSRVAQAACPRHDVETVYFGDGDPVTSSYHKVDSFEYAVDQTNMDMVVGGSITPIDKAVWSKLFLYYIEESKCRVPWHFFIDGGGSHGLWTSLSIRSSTDKIYGLMRGIGKEATQSSFVTIKRDWPRSPIEIKEFTISIKNTLKMIAPQSQTIIYIMGLNHMAWLKDTRYRPRVTHFENTSADNLDFALAGASLHVLKWSFNSKIYVVKVQQEFSDETTHIYSTISLPWYEDSFETPYSAVISVTEIKEDGQPTLDLIAACTAYDAFANNMNVWAIVTSANSVVDSEYAITTTDYLSCRGVNVVSKSAIYVVIEGTNGQLGLITMDADTETNQFRMQSYADFITFFTGYPKLTFLEQSGLESQFYYGGIFSAIYNQLGVIRSSIESRRVAADSHWDAYDPDTYEEASFVASSSFTDVNDEILSTLPKLKQVLKAAKILKPVDKQEYLNELFDTAETTDVLLEKSIKFNFAPHVRTEQMRLRYVAPGRPFRQTLDLGTDPEAHKMQVEVRNYDNPFWNLWAVQLGEAHLNFTVYSDEVKLGVNANLGKSDVTISFKDLTTGVRTNMTQPVEIITEGEYVRYETLGIIEPEPNWVLVAKQADQNANSGAGSSDDFYYEYEYYYDDSSFEDFGEDFDDDTDYGDEDYGDYDDYGDYGDGEYDGEYGDYEDYDGDYYDEYYGEYGEYGDEWLDCWDDDCDWDDENGGGGSRGGGGKSKSGGAGGGQRTKKTKTVCTDEVIYVDVEYENTFVAVNNEQELIDRFLVGYGTVDNYLRCYGGFVEAKEQKVSKKGTVTLSWGRPIVFPAFMLTEFDQDYFEKVPTLTPTEEELEDIRKVFERSQEQQAAQGATSTTQQTEIQTVCKEVEIEDDSPQNQGGSDAAGGDEEYYDEEYGDYGEEYYGEYGDYGDDAGDYGDDYGDYGDERRRRDLQNSEQFTRDVDTQLSLKDRISVTVIPGKNDLDEIKQEIQSYSFNVESASTTDLKIKINFDYPESVSTDREFPTFVEVKAKFSDFEPGWIDDLVLAYLEMAPQKKEKVFSVDQVQKLEAAEGAVSSAKQGTLFAMLLNIITSGAMAQIWGMINSMQIYTHLPMFKVLFPAFAQQTIAQTVEIANFEVLPIGDWFFEIIGTPEMDGDDGIATFLDAGFGSYYFMINMGTLMVVFFMSATIPFLVIIFFRPCKNRSKYAANKLTSTTNALYGNLLLRYILEAGLDISISIALQVYYSDLNGGLFNSTDAFFALNSVMTVILGPVVILAIVCYGIFYLCTFSQWSDESYDDRFGAVFEGLRKDTRLSLLYPLIFLVRRALFSVVAIFTQELLILQIACLFFFSTVQIIFLIKVEPFTEPLLQKMELFNEVCTLALVYIMVCFTDANEALFLTENYYDFAFMAGMATNLLVHVYFLLKNSFFEIRDTIKAKCFKHKAQGSQQQPNEIEMSDRKPIEAKLDVIQEEPELEQLEEVEDGTVVHKIPANVQMIQESPETIWERIKAKHTGQSVEDHQRKQKIEKMEQEIYVNRKKARDSRAKLEAIKRLDKQHKNLPKPDQVIVIKPLESKPDLFDQINLDKPRYQTKNIEYDLLERQHDIEQVGIKRDDAHDSELFGIISIPQMTHSMMIDTTKGSEKQYWNPTRLNAANLSMGNSKIKTDFNAVHQRNYSKSLESFKKIKLSEREIAEAKHKEEDEQLELSIATGFIQMQLSNRKVLEEEEKKDVSKSQNISEISLNEDH